jgi:hypothetical protein
MLEAKVINEDGVVPIGSCGSYIRKKHEEVVSKRCSTALPAKYLAGADNRSSHTAWARPTSSGSQQPCFMDIAVNNDLMHATPACLTSTKEPKLEPLPV